MTTTPVTKPWWLVPAGLILLAFVPVMFGAFRLTQLTVGAEVTTENARFFASPVPVVLHVIGATVFCVLGAFQFATALRRKRPRWHRIAGRIVLPAGLVAALSGMWMAVFYPHPPGVGPLLTGLRLLFGTAMAVSLVLGFRAIRRRDIGRHRAWVTRGYAIGIGAGTQFFTFAPWVLLVGQPGELAEAGLHAAGWLINLAVAEWVIRRSRRPVRAPRVLAAR